MKPFYFPRHTNRPCRAQALFSFGTTTSAADRRRRRSEPEAVQPILWAGELVDIAEIKERESQVWCRVVVVAREKSWLWPWVPQTFLAVTHLRTEETALEARSFEVGLSHARQYLRLGCTADAGPAL
eukprot:m.171507 g.171507  ORF g.171507 m.171507 type:complete len:127 (+) comp21260_c1_seq3:55-435(+)